MINDKCSPLDRSPDICPTQPQIFDQICQILPRGRAWQTHNTDVPREQSVMQRFWWAVSGFFEYVNDEMCRVIDEFFCDTVRDYKAVAYLEYGIPDDCGLYRDLCTKIRALPDDDCVYYKALAAELGYQIDCHIPRELVECYPCQTVTIQPEQTTNGDFTGSVLNYLGLDYPNGWTLYNFGNMTEAVVIGSNYRFTTNAHLGGISQVIAGSDEGPVIRTIRARRVAGDPDTQLRIYTGNPDEGTWVMAVPDGAPEGEWVTTEVTVEPTSTNFIVSSFVGTGATWEIDFISQKVTEGTPVALTGFAFGHTGFCNVGGPGYLRIDYCAPTQPAELLTNGMFDGGTADDGGRDVPVGWTLYNEQNVPAMTVENNRVRWTATANTGGLTHSTGMVANVKARRKARARRVSGSLATSLAFWSGSWTNIVEPNESPNGEWVTFEYDVVPTTGTFIVSQRTANAETEWEIEYVSNTDVPLDTVKSGESPMIFGHTGVGCEPCCIRGQLPEDLACVLDVVVPAHLEIQTIN